MPSLASFERRSRWLHSNVEPFLVASLLVCSADLNPVTSRLFVLAFLSAALSALVHWTLVIYRRGILRWLWDRVDWTARWLWRQLVALRELYWVKVVAGVWLAFLAASLSLWAREHVDVPRLLLDTLEFLRAIPSYLLDSAKLVVLIQQWLNDVALMPLSRVMGRFWASARHLILTNALRSAAMIGFSMLVFVVILWAGRRMRDWLLSMDTCDGCRWPRFMFAQIYSWKECTRQQCDFMLCDACAAQGLAAAHIHPMRDARL